MSTSTEDTHQHHHHHRHFHQQQQQHTIPVAAASTLPSVTDNADESPRPVGDALEQHCRLVEEELQNVRDSEARYKQQFLEAQRRERMLIRRLASKEQEMQDYATQNIELKAAQAPTQLALRQALLDPAVNILFQKIKAELQTTKARLEETQNELSAWKFTPDSNTGKRLMAKCRLLYQENEELGKMTTNGRLAKLEGDLALQKSFSEEVKKSQSELDDFLQELDEDVEGMQSTILFLQQELKLAKDTITSLERENCALKNGDNGDIKLCRSEHIIVGSESCESTNNLINGKKLSDNLLTRVTSTTMHTEDYETTTTTTAHKIFNHLNNSSINNNNCSERLVKKDCTKLVVNNSVDGGSSASTIAATITTTTMTQEQSRTLRSSSRVVNGSVGCASGTNAGGIFDDQQQQQQPQQQQRRANGGSPVDEPINYSHHHNYPPRKGYKRNYVPPLDNDTNVTSHIANDTVTTDISDANSLSLTTTSNNNNNNSNNSSNCKDGRTSELPTAGADSKVVAKKARRASVLSLDLNDDDDDRIEIDDEQSISGLTDASSSAANGTV